MNKIIIKYLPIWQHVVLFSKLDLSQDKPLKVPANNLCLDSLADNWGLVLRHTNMRDIKINEQHTYINF